MTVFIILLCVTVFFLTVYLKITEPKRKGKRGEKRVRRILGETIPDEQYVFNDYMIENDGKSSQVDHILINKKGIFVIETKNYAGRIYGNDNQHEWTQVLNYGRVKNKFYNPVKQNNTHLYFLHELLPGYKLKSVVVFVQNNTKYIQSEKVIGIDALQELVHSGEDILTADRMAEVVKLLNEQKENCNVTDKQHIEDIHNELEAIENNICPRCGGELVVRQGKYGEFYGCSNYPKCKFKKKK